MPLISHVQTKKELCRGATTAVIYANPMASNLGIPDKYRHISEVSAPFPVKWPIVASLAKRQEDLCITPVDGAKPVNKAPYRLNKAKEAKLE